MNFFTAKLISGIVQSYRSNAQIDSRKSSISSNKNEPFCPSGGTVSVEGENGSMSREFCPSGGTENEWSPDQAMESPGLAHPWDPNQA
nr:hypothetical protein Iba_chr10bCG12730 [Ipomoea batatas]